MVIASFGGTKPSCWFNIIHNVHLWPFVDLFLCFQVSGKRTSNPIQPCNGKLDTQRWSVLAQEGVYAYLDKRLPLAAPVTLPSLLIHFIHSSQYLDLSLEALHIDSLLPPLHLLTASFLQPKHLSYHSTCQDWFPHALDTGDKIPFTTVTIEEPPLLYQQIKPQEHPVPHGTSMKAPHNWHSRQLALETASHRECCESALCGEHWKQSNACMNTAMQYAWDCGFRQGACNGHIQVSV